MSAPPRRGQMFFDIQLAMDRQRSYIKPWPRMLGYLVALTAGLHVADEEKRLSAKDRRIRPEVTSSEPAEQPLLSRNDAPASPLSTPMILKSALSRPEFEDTQTYEPKLYKYIRNLIVPGHLLALSAMAVVVWTPWFRARFYPDYWFYGFTLFYNVFARLIWSLAVLWFVYTCFLAHHKIIKDPLTTTVNYLLSWRFFTLLSPTVFGVYLIHMMIQQIYYASLPITAYVSLFEGFHEFLGWAPVSFALAIPLYLMIELPAAKLL